MYLFYFAPTYEPQFRGWKITKINHAAICQKEAIESPQMERFWLIKYIKAGKL